ncbi:tyrosine-type recombinase/integrase [Nocardia aurea]|uniref:tyrosine-type recombinase/integrase n=1 Tax=Nocardia aurea TaxID=2144174 RepID=UPI0033AEC261
MDAYLNEVAQVGRQKARVQRVILMGMMGYAVRHDAIAENPVRDVSRLRRQRAKPRATDADTLLALRSHLADWCAGKDLPQAKRGPRRSPQILHVSDLALATGARPNEVFALRWCDVNFDAQPVQLTICGTIVKVKGKPLYRQEWTKNDAGYRTVQLPTFAVDTLLRLRAEIPPEASDDPERLIITNRIGGIMDSRNFNRRRSQARGPEFDWVTVQTFRKTVATMIAHEYGPDLAASQLGHASNAVTRAHYIDQPTLAPDFTAVLDRSVAESVP